MSEAVEVIRHEIARREAEISALQIALDALTGKTPERPAAKTKRLLALPAPSKPKKPRKARQETGEGGTFTVNGVEFELGGRLFAVANALDEAEDCVPAARLDALCGGKRAGVTQAIFYLNKQFRSAGAQIVHFRGEGYRLQNIEEDK